MKQKENRFYREPDKKPLAFILLEVDPKTGLREIVEVTFDEKEAAKFYNQDDNIVRDIKLFYIDVRGEAGDLRAEAILEKITGEC